MKKFFLILLGVCIVCLSGCNSSEKEEKRENDKPLNKKVKPLSKPGDPLPGGL